jgi:Uma2 family endonuclease
MATITIAPEPATDQPPFTPFHPYRLSEEEYFRLADAGVISDKAPVFLWKGFLVEKMTKGRPHTTAVLKMDSLVSSLVPTGWFVQQEQPISLGGGSVPEPDLSIVRGVLDDYLVETPRARDLGLVIEVSDSSLPADSTQMLAAYARAAIPCYWIVNIPQHRIDVYARPTGPSAIPCYASCQSFSPDEAVPLILDGKEIGRIAVRDVLP